MGTNLLNTYKYTQIVLYPNIPTQWFVSIQCHISCHWRCWFSERLVLFALWLNTLEQAVYCCWLSFAMLLSGFKFYAFINHEYNSHSMQGLIGADRVKSFMVRRSYVKQTQIVYHTNTNTQIKIIYHTNTNTQIHIVYHTNTNTQTQIVYHTNTNTQIQIMYHTNTNTQFTLCARVDWCWPSKERECYRERVGCQASLQAATKKAPNKYKQSHKNTRNLNAGRVNNEYNVIISLRVSDIKLVKVYALNKNKITQMQIHRNKYTNTNTNTFVDRVKSHCTVIVRGSDVKPATKKAPGFPLSNIQIQIHHRYICKYICKCCKQASYQETTRACFGHKYKVTFARLWKLIKSNRVWGPPPVVTIKSEFNIYLLRGWFIAGIKSRLMVKQWKHGSQSELGVSWMSSFGLRAFLRPIAHPPGAIKAGSGRRAFLRLIHPSSQASSSGQGAALVWRSFP